MKQYLLAVHSVEGEDPSPEETEQAYKDVDAFNQQLRARGAWVFGRVAPGRHRHRGAGRRRGGPDDRRPFAETSLAFVVPHGDETRPATDPLIQPLIGFFSELPVDRPLIWDPVFYEGTCWPQTSGAGSTPSNTMGTPARGRREHDHRGLLRGSPSATPSRDTTGPARASTLPSRVWG